MSISRSVPIRRPGSKARIESSRRCEPRVSSETPSPCTRKSPNTSIRRLNHLPVPPNPDILSESDGATPTYAPSARHGGIPDLQFDLHSVAASEDRAAAHATLRGTHRGLWSGLDPTGRSISVEHMLFFRFEHGRMVEVWELLDRSDLRRQLLGG
jgi:hypothetical protein